MQLGALMNQLADERDAAAALDAMGDVILYAEVSSMGERHEEAPGEYVANASRRFAALASDEDWLALMNAMERSQDPGRAALERMVRWALERDARPTTAAPAGGCGCGGGGGCHDHP